MKTQFLLLFLFSIACYNTVFGASITEQNAQAIALNFFKVNNPTINNAGFNASLTYTRKEGDGTIDFYAFNIIPGPGFVIVAADNNFTPILAYSTESNFDPTLNKTGIVNWMNKTADKIYTGIKQQVLANTAIKTQWTAYAQGLNPNFSRSGGSVSPMLTTTWNQEPYYNEYCPYNSSDQEQCVTGCVATAMAQIMKFWSYPSQGTGTYSYDDAPPKYLNNYGLQAADFDTTHYNWPGMPNYINSYNTEIGRLMYQCGVSVAMDYGDDNEGGSGSWVLQQEAGPGQPCAQNSYVAYFGYNPNTIQGVYQSQYTTSDWISLIENELNSGRVVQYQGTDPSPQGGGHTWVCDGYDVNDNFHMNWGWGGQDDGYFSCNDLNPATYTFSYDDAALIGIEPLSPVSVAAIADAQTLCHGSSTVITALGPSNATYSWSPTTGLINPTSAATTAAPTTTTTYVVTADSAGIIGHGTVTITVPKAVVASFTLNQVTSCSLPVTVTFSNTTTNGSNYLWNFGDGTTSTDTNPVHTYSSYNNYAVTLIASNSCGQDSNNQPNAVQVVNPAPEAGSKNICKGQSITLQATAKGPISWYNSSTGGTLLDTGSSYTTPPVNSNTYYYASTSFPSPVTSAGPTNYSMGLGGYFTNTNFHSIVFNCSVPQTLISVDVYAESSGYRTIELVDSNGTVLASATVNIPAGPQTVKLNVPIPAEDNLRLGIQGTNYLYRNKSGAAYPYASTDGTVVLTNSDAGTPGYYYFFYNWQMQQSPCTATTPVLVNVNSLSSVIEVAYSGNEHTTVTFTPVNSSATSFLWNFDDNNTSTDQDPTHTYKTVGTYDVSLVESNGSCTDTLSYSVNLATPTNLQNNTLISNWNLFPDPAKNIVNFQIQCGKDIENCKLHVYNILGETMLNQELGLVNGTNSLQLNVSSFAAGVYFITLQSDQYVTTKRFIKAGN